MDFELIKKWENFEGDLIVYHRKTPYRVKDFEDALIVMGFTKIESIPYVDVYNRKMEKEVNINGEK